MAVAANDLRHVYSSVMPCRQQCISIQRCVVAQSIDIAGGLLPPSPPLTLHLPCTHPQQMWRTGGNRRGAPVATMPLTHAQQQMRTLWRE